MAAVSPDPIYAAIDQHEQTVAVFDAAVIARSRFNDLNMDDERKRQLSLLHEAMDAALGALRSSRPRFDHNQTCHAGRYNRGY
jgi:hypothetical protein